MEALFNQYTQHNPSKPIAIAAGAVLVVSAAISAFLLSQGGFSTLVAGGKISALCVTTTLAGVATLSLLAVGVKETLAYFGRRRQLHRQMTQGTDESFSAHTRNYHPSRLQNDLEDDASSTDESDDASSIGSSDDTSSSDESDDASSTDSSSSTPPPPHSIDDVIASAKAQFPQFADELDTFPGVLDAIETLILSILGPTWEFEGRVLCEKLKHELFFHAFGSLEHITTREGQIMILAEFLLTFGRFHAAPGTYDAEFFDAYHASHDTEIIEEINNLIPAETNDATLLFPVAYRDLAKKLLEKIPVGFIKNHLLRHSHDYHQVDPEYREEVQNTIRDGDFSDSDLSLFAQELNNLLLPRAVQSTLTMLPYLARFYLPLLSTVIKSPFNIKEIMEPYDIMSQVSAVQYLPKDPHLLSQSLVWKAATLQCAINAHNATQRTIYNHVEVIAIENGTDPKEYKSHHKDDLVEPTKHEKAILDAEAKKAANIREYVLHKTDMSEPIPGETSNPHLQKEISEFRAQMRLYWQSTSVVVLRRDHPLNGRILDLFKDRIVLRSSQQEPHQHLAAIKKFARKESATVEEVLLVRNPHLTSPKMHAMRSSSIMKFILGAASLIGEQKALIAINKFVNIDDQINLISFNIAGFLRENSNYLREINPHLLSLLIRKLKEIMIGNNPLRQSFKKAFKTHSNEFKALFEPGRQATLPEIMRGLADFLNGIAQELSPAG